MYKAGLINVIDTSSKDGISYEIKGITWEGHDFLDAARNEQVLEKAKETAKSKGFDFKSLPIDLAKQLLVEAAKVMIFGS